MEGAVKVFIGGLTEQVKREDIEEEFARFGKIVHTWVAFNPPGFAFTEFETAEEAESAVNDMNGTTLWGCTLRVELSRRESRGRRGGGRGGFRGGRGDSRQRDSRSGGYGGGRGGGGGFRGGRGFRGGSGGGDRYSSGGGGRGGGGGSGWRGYNRDGDDSRNGGYDNRRSDRFDDGSRRNEYRGNDSYAEADSYQGSYDDDASNRFRSRSPTARGGGFDDSGFKFGGDRSGGGSEERFSRSRGRGGNRGGRR